MSPHLPRTADSGLGQILTLESTSAGFYCSLISLSRAEFANLARLPHPFGISLVYTPQQSRAFSLLKRTTFSHSFLADLWSEDLHCLDSWTVFYFGFQFEMSSKTLACWRGPSEILF